MNYNAKPTQAERLAYINQKVDMKDEKTAELAKAALKTANELMKDMKAQNLIFTDSYENSKGETKTSKSAAVVKVTKATEMQDAKLPSGQVVKAEVPKVNKNGDEIYNASISIRKGAETLQFSCSQYPDGDKLRITSVRWSEFNRANPKASPSAKGVEEIAKSKASPELKAIAEAADKGGYIRGGNDGISFDQNLDTNDAKAMELANAMKATMKPVMDAMREQNKLFELTTTKDGEEKTYTAFASVGVTPRKNEDGTPKLNDNGGQRYFVQATIYGKNESLTIGGSDHIGEDGTVRLTALQAADFTGGKGNTVRFSGNEAIQKSPLSAEIKALADAIDKGGFVQEYDNSELRNLAYKLNTETFKTKVLVEVEDEKGNKSDAERKLLNANYNPESEVEGKDGKTYTNPESITIFNKSADEMEKAILVQFTISEQYGNSVQAVNTALTPVTDDKGKTIDFKPKQNKEDPSYRVFVNSAEDVVNFCPDLPELQQAIADFKGIDIEAIKDARENASAEIENGGAEKSEPAETAVAEIPDDDRDFDPDDFEEIDV